MTLGRLRRPLAATAVFALFATIALATSPDTSVGYLVRQGYFQAALLWGRVPLEEARSSFDEKKQERFDQIPRIQAFGDQIGLASGTSYQTIHPTWDRTIYNVSACDPVRFRSVKWRFPIVGRVPYLGYFTKEDALRRRRALADRGYDVYLRTAGAYSTLGWFSDPVLPQMLGWSEGNLANTLLHERAHATVWIPGSVRFNESFANFVGQEAELRYLAHTYGEDGEPLLEELARREHSSRYNDILRETYAALDEVYKNRDLTRAEKLRDKGLIIAAIPTRVSEVGLPDRYVRAAGRPWNNARLVQFRTYNSSGDQFAAILEQEGGDLLRFMERIGEIGRGADDPYAALSEAAALEDP